MQADLNLKMLLFTVQAPRYQRGLSQPCPVLDSSEAFHSHADSKTDVRSKETSVNRTLRVLKKRYVGARTAKARLLGLTRTSIPVVSPIAAHSRYDCLASE